MLWLLNEAQAREQRFELVNELHGTVLQILAATSMQLQVIAPRLAAADPDLARRVRMLIDALAAEHGAFRRDLQKFATPPDSGSLASVQLQRRLQQLAQAVQRQWRLQMDWNLEPPNAKVTRDIDRELALLLAEAAADAKRHSDASHLAVSVNVQPNNIRVTFSNGRTGGPADEADLGAFAPSALRRRVARLGGAVKVHTGTEGIALDISIPVQSP